MSYADRAAVHTLLGVLGVAVATGSGTLGWVVAVVAGSVAALNVIAAAVTGAERDAGRSGR